MKQRPMAYFSLYSKKQSLLVVILKNNGHGLGWLTVPMRPKKAKASIQNTFKTHSTILEYESTFSGNVSTMYDY